VTECFSLVIAVLHGIDCYCSFVLGVEKINFDDDDVDYRTLIE